MYICIYIVAKKCYTSLVADVCPSLYCLTPEGNSTGHDWCSVSSTSLTVEGGTPPRSRHNRGGNKSINTEFNAVDILTGEAGKSAAVAGGWLSGAACGERNLVASGMEAVGALDPEEVLIFCPLRLWNTLSTPS